MLISGYNSGNLNLPRKFTAMVDSEKGTDVSVLDSTALFRGVLYGIWTKLERPQRSGRAVFTEI